MSLIRFGKLLLNATKCNSYRSPFYFLQNELHLTRCLGSQSYNKSRSFIPEKLNKSHIKSGTDTHNTLNESSNTNLENDMVNYVQKIEKMFFQLSLNIKNRNRVYKNEVVRLTSSLEKTGCATEHQARLLLSCCSNLLPDETPSARMDLLLRIRNLLERYVTFNTSHYNEILRCYTENNHKVSVANFLNSMGSSKPNDMTYQLLVENSCKAGDMNQAAEILGNMKVAMIPVTESVLVSLINGHGRSGNVQMAKEIYKTYKTLNIPVTAETETAIINLSILNDANFDLSADLQEAQNKGAVFSESNIMSIVECLLSRNYQQQVPIAYSYLPKLSVNMPILSPYLQSVCTQLVHQGHAASVYSLLKMLPVPSAESEDQLNFGKTFLKDCVKSSTPIELIKKFALDMIDSGHNKYALNIVCEVALVIEKKDVAVEFLYLLKENNSPIRCHYFWPLLMSAARKDGEIGVFDTLTLMNKFGIKIDNDTLYEYVMPHLNMSSPQSLLRKFQNYDINVSHVLTPMLLTLLKNNDIKEAAVLCEIYEDSVISDPLVHPLLQALKNTEDHECAFTILSKFDRRSETNKDAIGFFLILLASNRKWKIDMRNLNYIAKELKKSDISITNGALESCINHVEQYSHLTTVEKEELKNNLRAIKNKSDFSEHVDTYITHPKNMTVDSMEAHLIELESKEMNTRGILRKLLQQYCRVGNIEKAKNIIAKCDAQKLVMSPGMRSSIMDIHVRDNNLELAEKCYQELRTSEPNFEIDEFKLLNLSNLLVSKGHIKDAFNILEERGKGTILGGKSQEPNCWKILQTLAATGDVKLTQDMFLLLTKYGYCLPSNIILGPLIRVHINTSNMAGAIEDFKKYATTYRKTPLKHEILCHLLKTSVDISTPSAKESAQESKRLILEIIEIDKKMYGPIRSKIAIVSALADLKLKKQLRQLLLDPSVPIKEEMLLKQCERFGFENKLEVLEVLAESVEGLRSIHAENIYEIIMKVHSVNSSCHAAMELWTRMQEKNVRPTQNIVEILCSMLKSHKLEVPLEILSYLDSNTKKKILNS